MIRGWTRGQLVLRVLVLAGPLVALLAAGLQGDSPGRGILVLTAVLGIGAALYPDSQISTVAMLVVLAFWGVVPTDTLHPSSVLAAGALLVAHVAGVLASYGPDDLPLDPTVTVTWVRRAAAVFSAVPLTWLLADGLHSQPEPAGIWVAALLAAIGAVLLAGWALDDRAAG